MKIYNSLTRKKDEFIPIKDGEARIYVCGPTVYDEPHIGHARSAYIFDVIKRYLEYKKFKVTFVRNVTDVDDKIITKAKQEFKDEDLKTAVRKVSDKYLAAYHKDMALLGLGQPDKEPKATEYIKKMQEFINLLIERGKAYVSDGDVYFDIKQAKDYGKLSNQSLDKMEAGARVAPGEKKRDPLDFVLWKAAKEGEPSWPSPWGQGRPGWHIECSVMSSDILGDEFDIHGGGIDLIFPHHENELAQSKGAGKGFARFWIHNGLLTINSEKMAKSLGNYITVRDALKDLPDDNATDILKVFFLQALYGKPIDYSKETIQDAKAAAWRLLEPLNYEPHIKDFLSHLTDKDKNDIDAFKNIFIMYTDDDFNTRQASSVLFDLVRYCNRRSMEKTQEAQSAIQYAINMIRELGNILGLSMKKTNPHDQKWGSLSVVNVLKDVLKDDEWIETKINERNKARKEKDFKRADAIRKELYDKGVILKDAQNGKTEWEWRKKN